MRHARASASTHSRHTCGSDGSSGSDVVGVQWLVLVLKAGNTKMSFFTDSGRFWPIDPKVGSPLLKASKRFPKGQRPYLRRATRWYGWFLEEIAQSGHQSPIQITVRGFQGRNILMSVEDISIKVFSFRFWRLMSRYAYVPTNLTTPPCCPPQMRKLTFGESLGSFCLLR